VLTWLSVCSKVHMICYLYMVQLMPLSPYRLFCLIKIQIDLIFLVPAYPCYPGKEAVKWVSVFFKLSHLFDFLFINYIFFAF